jgi:hypothetical protein
MTPRWNHTLTILLAVALIAAAGFLHRPLRDARRDAQLVHAEPLENAPPLLVISTVALGGFSGILADLLWVRAGQRQMEGQYLELVQLADWITKLQPRFAAGWVYHAWNLSYNVSVMFPRPEDRWRWVRHGLHLLRDGGLRYNPENPTLYRELTWLFMHKLGMDSDAAHRFYKQAWADEMQRLFDGPGPDYTRWNSLPNRLDTLLRDPATAAAHAALQRQNIALFDRDGLPNDLAAQWAAAAPDQPTPPPAALANLQDFARRQAAQQVYQLRPDIMQAIETEFGPLDWRWPQTHAVYWAWRGLPLASGWEQQLMDRMIFQSLVSAFRQGRFFYSPTEQQFIPAPNPDLLDSVRIAFDRALAEHDLPGMREAHTNFLQHAIVVLYTHDRAEAARALYMETHPNGDPAAFEDHLLAAAAAQPEYALLNSPTDRLTHWTALHYTWHALGDDAQASGYGQLARLLLDRELSDLTTAQRRTIDQRARIQSLAQVTQPAARQRIESAPRLLD